MFVVPSAVSSAIKRLEDEFQTVLFSRSANRLTPTAQGDVFYERALAVMAAVSLLEQRMRFPASELGKKPQCRIAMATVILSVYGDEIYDELSKCFPEYYFDIVTYTTIYEPDFYKRYDITVAMTYFGQSFKGLNKEDGDFLAAQLCSFEPYVWISASSPLNVYPVLTYELLKDCYYVTYNDFMPARGEQPALLIAKEPSQNIKIKKYFIHALENTQSFTLDMPIVHGKLWYEDLFKDCHLTPKKLADTSTIEIIYRKNYAKNLFPSLSQILSRLMVL